MGSGQQAASTGGGAGGTGGTGGGGGGDMFANLLWVIF